MEQADSGVARHMTFLVFNDTHFHKKDISKRKGEYQYFKYIDAPSTVDSLYQRVMALSSRVITKDAMGASCRVIDIFGYTPLDIMQLDYASLEDLERSLTEVENEHDRQMNSRVNDLDDLQKEQAKQS